MTRRQYLQEKLTKEEWDWVLHNELAVRNLMKSSEVRNGKDKSEPEEPGKINRISKDEKLVLETTRALMDRVFGKEEFWKTSKGQTSDIYSKMKTVFKDFLASSAKYATNLRKLTRAIDNTSNSFKDFIEKGNGAYNIQDAFKEADPYFKDFVEDLYNKTSGDILGRNSIGKGEMVLALIFDDLYLDKHSNMKGNEEDPDYKYKHNYGFNLIYFDDEVPVGIAVKRLGSRLDGNDFRQVYFNQRDFRICADKFKETDLGPILKSLKSAIYPKGKDSASLFSESVIRNCWVTQNWTTEVLDDLTDFLVEMYKYIFQAGGFANSGTEVGNLAKSMATEIISGNVKSVVALDVLIRLIIYMQSDKNKQNRLNSFVIIFDDEGSEKKFYTVSFGGKKGDDVDTIKKDLISLLNNNIWFRTNGGTSIKAIAPKIVKIDWSDEDKQIIIDTLNGKVNAPTPKEYGGSKATAEMEIENNNGGLLKKAMKVRNENVNLKEAVREDIDEIVEMNANKVFIGDICYALDEDIYRKVWGEELGYEDGIVSSGDEIYAVVGGTAYGDGSYKGSDGIEYGVDAGVIGVTNLTYMDKDEDEESLNNLGKVVDIPSGRAEVSFSVNTDGEFSIAIRDAESGSMLYRVEILTAEEEELTCFDCGETISQWEYDRYGGRCESCYFGEEDEEEEEEEDDWEDEEDEDYEDEE